MTLPIYSIVRLADGKTWRCSYTDGSGTPLIGEALTPGGALTRCMNLQRTNSTDPRDHAMAFKRLRMRRRVSLKEAATTLHMTQAALTRAETMQTETSPEQFRSWARSLGWSMVDYDLSLRDVALMNQSG